MKSFPCEKLVLRLGTGSCRPNDFSKCRVVLRFQTPPPVSQDAMRYEQDVETDITIGQGSTSVECALDTCLLTMTEGEVSTIAVPMPSGASCLDRDGVEVTSLRIEVTLISFELAANVHTLSAASLFARAAAQRDVAAACYKNGRVDVAFRKYGRSLKYLICADAVGTADDKLRAEMEKLRCQCFLNLTACQIQTNNWSPAIDNCTRALAIEPGNVKGLYRRAQCLTQAGDNVRARLDLERALEVEPNNKVLLKCLASVRDSIRRSDEQIAKAMSKMFT